MPAYDVILKKVAPLQVAQAYGIAPTREKIGPTLDHLFDQVFDYIKQHGATVAGPAITLYYDTEYGERNLSLGACMSFQGSLSDGEQVKISTLPGAENMASVIHRGSFDTLTQAYNAILKWTSDNGYQISGPNRELNLEYERGGDQSKFVTEIQFPVEKQ